MSIRPILASEYAIIRSAYADPTLSQQSKIYVVQEEHSESQFSRSQLFNGDFTLWLLPELPPLEDRIVRAIPVKPFSMGAEYFVTIRNDGAPVLLDLMGGESIPRESFADSIQQIDKTIKGSLGMSCADSAYLRIAELAEGISFLVATSHVTDFVGLPSDDVSTSDSRLFVRKSGHGRVMIDGVITMRSGRNAK